MSFEPSRRDWLVVRRTRFEQAVKEERQRIGDEPSRDRLRQLWNESHQRTMAEVMLAGLPRRSH
jgi:hypothetical protein